MCHALYVSTTTEVRTSALMPVSTIVVSDAANATSAKPAAARNA